MSDRLESGAVGKSGRNRPVFRRCLDALGHLLLLACTALIFVLLQVGALIFLPFRRQTWTAGTVRFLFRRVLGMLVGIWRFLGLVHLSVEGKPTVDAGTVFLANHPSFVDAVFLLPRLPNTVCLYKAALESLFLPRSLLVKAGFVSNAGGVESIRESAEQLKRGRRLLLFPEGTRTTVPLMEPWKTSYALIAARGQASVQSIFIDMSSPIFPKGAPWWRPAEFPVRVRIRFGLSVPPPQEHTVRNFHREVEASFRHELVRFQTVSADSPD